MDTLMQLTDVSQRYDSDGSPAVAHVSVEVSRGEPVAIMGASGSAKSTLLNLIAGLDRPAGGSVTVGGERIEALSEIGLARYRRRPIGVIFQFFNLLDDMTVADNVLLPAQLADEPTGALDTANGEAIGELLLDLNVSGQTLIMVTHHPDLAARCARRVIEIVDGQIASDAHVRGALR